MDIADNYAALKEKLAVREMQYTMAVDAKKAAETTEQEARERWLSTKEELLVMEANIRNAEWDARAEAKALAEEQQKVIKERDELAKKCRQLNASLAHATNLSIVDEKLLKNQLKSMITYRNLLNVRIEGFNRKNK